MKRFPILLMIALLVTVSLALAVQVPTDPDLVYVRVTAIETTRNRPIRGLHKEDFKVFENNTPQDIVYFSDKDLPLRMGILVDASDSTKSDISRAMSGLKSTVYRDDDFFLMEYGKAPLGDAILQALKELELRGNQGKRALVLFTSRKNPGSYPLAMVRERLKELDIQFYVAAHQTGSDVSGDIDRDVLKDLTERTGGSAYFPTSSFDQTAIFKQIVGQQRNQYLIGYRSTNRATDGKWRKIRIAGEYLDHDTGKIKKANLLAKTGYYAPTAPR